MSTVRNSGLISTRATYLYQSLDRTLKRDHGLFPAGGRKPHRRLKKRESSKKNCAFSSIILDVKKVCTCDHLKMVTLAAHHHWVMHVAFSIITWWELEEDQARLVPADAQLVRDGEGASRRRPGAVEAAENLRLSRRGSRPPRRVSDELSGGAVGSIHHLWVSRSFLPPSHLRCPGQNGLIPSIYHHVDVDVDVGVQHYIPCTCWICSTVRSSAPVLSRSVLSVA